MPAIFQELFTVRGIKQVGFPIVAAIAVCWFIVRYMGPGLDEQVKIIGNANRGMELQNSAIPQNANSMARIAAALEKSERTQSRLVRWLERAEVIGIPEKPGKPMAVNPREIHQEPEL